MSAPVFRWSLPAAFVGLVVGVLGFYGSGIAAPQQPPFASSVEQRSEMIQELREIKELLKEQNALLRAAAKANEKPKPR
ncbi:MAG: hypothetical protein SFU86_18655 [Pirellulaceae bacterium]|nr:hypothetical protein [Pirellulaceae bacterium]